MRLKSVIALIAVVLPFMLVLDLPSTAASGPGQEGQENRRPRSDDPRSRDWGAPNERGESGYDDRKSPRKVGFLGRSANVRIYPNYSDPSVYLQLRFGKIQELDAAGRPVPGHMVPSLAEAANVTFAAGNTTVNGVNMSYVNVSLNPLGREGFTWNCSAGGGSDNRPRRGHHLLSRRSLLGSSSTGLPSGAAAPQVNVSLLFGLDGALTVPYGDVNITIPPNGLKWTVSYANWPFCNVSNTLSVSLQLLVANNASAQVASDAANNGTQQLRIVLGSAYNATLGFLNYALDGAAAASGDTTANATRMPVNVTLLGQGEQGVTTVAMGLPNPAAYGVSSGSVWYDPTQTTTSAYLTADDPGNVATATLTTTVESGGSGSAGSLRAGVWTAACTTLLSALVRKMML